MVRMPQIDADTVAEHRARQRNALLDTAREILLSDGYDALTFGALGERTGLARNSVYRYFASRDEVIAELCEREAPAWSDAIDRAMEPRAQLEMLIAGHHELGAVLQHAPMGPPARKRITALTHAPTAQLSEALRAEGHTRPDITAELVQGLVAAAFRLLQDRRGQAREIVASTVAAARHIVGAR